MSGLSGDDADGACAHAVAADGPLREEMSSRFRPQAQKKDEG